MNRSAGQAPARGLRMMLVWLLAWAIMPLGCGGSGERLVPVAGRVTLAGQSVVDATIIFECREPAVSRSARLGADGRYEMADYRSVGLPPGLYRVAVVPGRFLDPGEELAPLPPPGQDHSSTSGITRSIPERFTRPDTSGLEATVVFGESRSFDFVLER